jgi:hypothetical protein
MTDEVRLKRIPVGVIHALQDLADKRGCSMEKVLQDAVNTEIYMNEQLEKGSQILCKDTDGKTRRVVFTHME